MEEVFYTNSQGKRVSLDDTLGNDWGWLSGKTKVIRHSKVQELAEKENLFVQKYDWVITPNEGNLQQHTVIVTIAGKEDFWKNKSPVPEVGEACRLNTGGLENGSYKEHRWTTGKAVIDANYRASMAWKRAYDRAVLSFLGLYDVYSSSESKDFQKSSEEGGGFNY